MKILAIDSSGLVASAAIVEDDVLLAEYTIHHKKTHSQTLLPMIDEIVRMLSLDLMELDAIAVAGGPGSFTGLRIGSATAKGLGFALDKPLIQIPTVDGLAYNLAGCGMLVCPLMDARRNQVYTGLYAFEGYQMHTLIAQCAVGIEEIIEKVNEKERAVTFLGDGAAVYASYIKEHCSVPFTFAPAHLNKQRASAVAALAVEYYRAGRLQDAAAHRPEYLRLSQAERERLAKKSADFTIEIRRMQEGQAEQAAALEAQVFSVPWSAQAFTDALRLDHTLFYTAFVNGNFAGYCGMYLAADEGEITNVAVAPAYRRHQVARSLLAKLFADAAQKGVRQIFLEVRRSNQAAIHLYQKMGFVSSGVRHNFYQDPTEDALVMRCQAGWTADGANSSV